MLFQCCQCLGRVVGMPGRGEAEKFSVFCTEAADELLEVGVVAYIRIDIPPEKRTRLSGLL